jgi:ketosteroid isomerase-like protein
LAGRVSEGLNVRVLDESLFDAGDFVVNRTLGEFVSRKTGESIELPVVEFYWLEDGKIVEILPFYWDTNAVARLWDE